MNTGLSCLALLTTGFARKNTDAPLAAADRWGRSLGEELRTYVSSRPDVMSEDGSMWSMSRATGLATRNDPECAP
jgi:hypothetical protein